MEKLDSLRLLATPEGVDIELHSAGPLIRLLAFIIDGALRLLLLIPLLFAVALLEQSGTWIYLLLLFLIQWFYFTIFEAAMDGQTPGKRAMGIRVIRENGTALTWNASIIRNLLRVADGFLFSYIVGLIVLCFSDGFRRIGDHAAGSVVVYNRRALPAAATRAPDLRPAAPSAELTLPEQQAILEYSDRRHLLSDERAEELARILAGCSPSPLPGGARSLPEQLDALAAWIRGGSGVSAGGAE
jgi:uncharacterized RDD family membrane protein YckC